MAKAATLLGPFEIGFPVAFHSGGDTTREAFGKHINEIKRIYEYLNALDIGKMSVDDLDTAINSKLNAHINSTNPHPNWKPSFSFSDITGTLDASRVHGTLTNAYIDASHVNNLNSFVKTLIPPDKGDGITTINTGDNGHIQFNNGLIMQWGTKIKETIDENATQVNFPTTFPSKCFNVVIQIVFDKDIGSHCNLFPQILKHKITKSGFSYVFQAAEQGPDPSYAGHIGVSFIAIGI